MARYRWETKTAYVNGAGTDANVFLSLSGDKATLKETEINDPDSSQDWEKGDINHGLIETADLGWIKTGTLKHDGWGAGPDWMVEYVKITNDEDGREWTATIGKWDDWAETQRGFKLRFTQTSAGQFEQLQKKKAEQARKKAADEKAAEDARKAAEKAAKEAKREKEREAQKEKEEKDFEDEMADADRKLDRELEKARKEAELARKREELDKLRGTSTTPAGGGPAPAGFRTYEVYGMMGGARVPLTSAVSMATGGPVVQPGARVMVTDNSGEGFGLAGSPGRWGAYYAGRSPSEFGLDPDKAVLASDGSRGWALTSAFLTQLFGAGWRAAIY